MYIRYFRVYRKKRFILVAIIIADERKNSKKNLQEVEKSRKTPDFSTLPPPELVTEPFRLNDN